jgi:hypothetical protein
MLLAIVRNLLRKVNLAHWPPFLFTVHLSMALSIVSLSLVLGKEVFAMATPTDPSYRETTSAVARPPKLLDRLRQLLVQRGCTLEEINGQINSVASFIRYHGLRHPWELGPEHVANFLARLRREPECTPQREAAARVALEFLYKEFLPGDRADAKPQAAICVVC